MKICVAQTRAVIGNVAKNIDRHKELAELAASHGADAIIFPELSLSGYEPTRANQLATTKDDEQFNQLQVLSDSKGMIIGAGMPLKTDQGISIGMILFQPNQPRQAYFKQHLHPDEEPFFIKGMYQPVLSEKKIAIAICYEISIPLHVEQTHKNGAKIYIASVAKTIAGVDKAIETLSETAKKYSMVVLLSNCIGECEGKEAGGRSSAWNNKGTLLGQLDNGHEGILMLDTITEELFIIGSERSS